MTYTAYEMNQDGRPVRVMFRGEYSAIKARAEKIQDRHYSKTGDHKPIFITAEIFKVAAA